MATQHCECASMPGVRRTIGAITLVDGRRTQLPERSPSRSSPSCPSSCALTLISSTEALREVARTRMHTPNACESAGITFPFSYVPLNHREPAEHARRPLLTRRRVHYEGGLKARIRTIWTKWRPDVEGSARRWADRMYHLHRRRHRRVTFTEDEAASSSRTRSRAPVQHSLSTSVVHGRASSFTARYRHSKRHSHRLAERYTRPTTDIRTVFIYPLRRCSPSLV
ncbi:hypothetical protein BD626DRAFT_507320 [Schizophyllum amplum]|uniref:Uncharacterized protein n=1 Tax=Schizophyllum amplum TaxID=97359 RepID=A0A550C3W8_9AGAR|nr:hypothetical protein BD626DRAFT_507320 [Auriculariopsis ampla]